MAHPACGAWRRRSDQVPRTTFNLVPNLSYRRHSQTPTQLCLQQRHGESRAPWLPRRLEVRSLDAGFDYIRHGYESASDDESDSKEQRYVLRRKRSVKDKLDRASVDYMHFESMLDFMCKSNELASCHHRRMLLQRVILAWHMHTIARMQEKHDFELGFLSLRKKLSFREVLYSQDLVTRCIFDHWYWFAFRKTRLAARRPKPSEPPNKRSEARRCKDRQKDVIQADCPTKSHQLVQPMQQKRQHKSNERCQAKLGGGDKINISKKKPKRRRRRRQHRLVSGYRNDSQEAADPPYTSRSQKSARLRLPE